jgi:hypothetical protein
MSPSRRSLLRLAGVAVAATVAGCSAIGSDRQTPSSESTATDSTGDSEAPSAGERFAVRLRGPDTDRVLFTGGDIGRVGTVETRTGVPGFTITLTDSARQAVAAAFQTAGVTEAPEEFEIVQTSADRRYEVAPGLAANIASGEWDGRLRLTYATENRAQRARDRLVGDDS